ncbi:MAG: serine/threonine-protein kinase [Acidobacteriota bacterium]
MARYPEPGMVLLGKYRVDSLIGEGGMGAVLKAQHLDLDELVAIKVLLPEMMAKKDIELRFLREAKAAVKLKGEHVARVLDVGRLDEAPFIHVPYIVMEYLDGADLNAIIKAHGPQEPAVAVDLMLQACEAIAEAHSLGIIHRDIKASNFYIQQNEGEPPRLKVLDFGIATTPAGVSELTDGQSVIGTPAYMAPEQMRATRIADARSDIWSMGVVLYEMLEGKRPFRADVYSDLCLKIGMDPPEEMVVPSVPEGLRAVVMKCLEKPIERRYQSVAELAFDLMPFASDPVLARASVETCARMLGRRSTRSLDVARAPDDMTPAATAPRRLTPPSVPIVGDTTPDRTPSGDASVRAPTSIQASSGEVGRATTPAPVKSRRRWLVIAASFAAAATIGGAGLYIMNGGRDTSAAPPAPAVQPTETVMPVEKPTPPVQVTPPDAPVANATRPGPDAGAAPKPPKPPRPPAHPLHPKYPRPPRPPKDDVYGHRQ